MKSITAIIINYRTALLTCACIASLRQQHTIHCEIIVVDNDSQDDSLAIIQTQHPDILALASPYNCGFGQANNYAMQYATHPHCLLINPDARFASPNELSNLYDFHQRGQFGLTGAVVTRATGQVNLPHTHYIHHKALRYPHHALAGQIAWVIGACMLVDKHVFNIISGFDPDFFLYGEETDLCLRLRLAGYQLGYCTRARVVHIGGASERGNSIYAITQKKRRAQLLLYQKHYKRQLIVPLIYYERYRALVRACFHRVAYWMSQNPIHKKRFTHYQAIRDTTLTHCTRQPVAE